MSSPLTSSEKTASENELSHEEELESLDESLDAILSEAQEPAHEQPGSVDHVGGEVQMVLAESTVPTRTGDVDDDKETPLPVIVDELPSYKAFADEVAPSESVPAAEVESALATSPGAPDEQVFEAESLVESMTPAPETVSPAEAFAAAPAADEDFLNHVVLPPGTTPAPVAAAGQELEDDATVISPMPPMAAPEPPRPALPMYSTWAPAGGAPVEAAPPSVVLLRQSEGLGDKLIKFATSRVHTSVAQLALVVLASAALGGVAVRMATDKPAHKAPAAETAKAEPAAPAEPTPAAEPAKAEPAKPEPAVAEKAEAKPATKPAPAAAKPHAAPAATHVALATPKPAAAKPAAKPQAKKPAGKPASSAGWVDPFGQ